jgi:Tfp pilus assembly protein PilF
MEPFQFTFSLQDFDLKLLPIDEGLLKENPDLFREAITTYLAEEFKKMGGRAEIAVHGDSVSAKWVPDELSGYEAIVNYSVGLLQQGAYKQAEPFLNAILKRFPDDSTVLFNYGMVLSDQGRLDDAIRHLSRAVTINPTSARAWNALGIAFHRKGDEVKAVESLKKSLSLDSNDPYTLRNLGGLLAERNPNEALSFLARAARLLPKDQSAGYGYSLCLYNAGKHDEADEELQRTIGISAYTQIAELCRGLRTKIAHSTMRKAVGGGLRMDVVMYCLGAMKKFDEVGLAKTQTIASEIALLGRNGLDINDPAQKYHLQSLPGNFSGLQMVAYMYVGFKRIAPELDAGIDFSNEFKEALVLHKAK